MLIFWPTRDDQGRIASLVPGDAENRGSTRVVNAYLMGFKAIPYYKYMKGGHVGLSHTLYECERCAFQLVERDMYEHNTFNCVGTF